jgi:hypothetical protein
LPLSIRPVFAALLAAAASCSSEPLQAPGHPDSKVAPIRIDPIPAEWGEAELLAEIAACEADQLGFRTELRRRLLDFQPENAELKLRLGRDLAELGHHQLSEALLHEAAADAEWGIQATLALANLQERRGRFLVAASLLEQRAQQASTDSRRTLLERASRLRQKGGDLPGSLRNLEEALNGIKVSDGEQRLLEQMRAYQNGEFAHTADASQVLYHHENADLRLKAAQYLAADPNTSPAIFADALSDASLPILELAIDELTRRSEGLEAPSLLPLLDHEVASIRQATTKALGKLRTPEAVAGILQRLQPEDRAMFRTQNMALERICGHSVAPDLDPDAERRQQIAGLWLEWFNQQS